MDHWPIRGLDSCWKSFVSSVTATAGKEAFGGSIERARTALAGKCPRDGFASLHAPLIKGINAENSGLNKDAMFIKRNQCANQQ